MISIVKLCNSAIIYVSSMSHGLFMGIDKRIFDIFFFFFCVQNKNLVYIKLCKITGAASCIEPFSASNEDPSS